MYQNFEKILKEKNLKPADVSRECNIAPSTLCDWKMGRSTPKADKLVKIAKYLGTTIEHLME